MSCFRAEVELSSLEKQILDLDGYELGANRVAFALRISEDQAESTMRHMAERGLLERSRLNYRIPAQPDYSTEEKPLSQYTRCPNCSHILARHTEDGCLDCECVRWEKPVESGAGEPDWENIFTVTEQLDGGLKISPHREGFALMYLVPKREADARMRQAMVERNDGLALAAEFQAKYAALKAAEGEGSR